MGNIKKVALWLKKSSQLIHVFNYFGANIATKAISFISIPIFTRLLSVADYGILNLYSTYIGIFGVVMTLNVHSSISRYFYDKRSEEDFKKFAGTTTLLTIFIYVPFLFGFIFFRNIISEWLQIPTSVIVFIPLTIIIGTTASIFMQIMQPLYESKKIARVIIISSYSSFILSIFFLFFLSKEKYFAQIWGQLIVGALFFFYYLKTLKPFVTFTFDKKYLSYIFQYSIPLIPHALSGVILNQIDRVMINKYEGAGSTGMYSFAYNIAMLMSIFVVSIYQAWIPKYFEYMNAKDYEGHDKDVDRLNRLTVLVAVALSLFGRELGIILAAKNFHASLSIIPIVVVGYVFEGLFTIYGRDIGYSRKTIYATIIALSSGGLNIWLNTIYIPIYGYQVAAWTTLISYIFMALLAWLINIMVLKIHTYSLLKALIPISLLIPVLLLNHLINEYFSSLLLGILIKTILLSISLVSLFGFKVLKTIKDASLAKK